MHPCTYASIVAPCDEVFPVATCIKSLDAILHYGCVHSKSDAAVKKGRVVRQLCDEGAHIIYITFKTCSLFCCDGVRGWRELGADFGYWKVKLG